uniref:Uncharacterized protein n=1 Tax=Candidatus Kentrum sp. DK TaxID=2126562 RepID=A0A450SG19_9GAMM|nr:MAG: hypothetical protein BECKDK2373B_GA0170837_10353 [Candidatus Kentron sp. DK]
MPLLEFVPGPPICALEGVFFVLTLCVGMPGVARGRNQIEKAIAVRLGSFLPRRGCVTRLKKKRLQPQRRFSSHRSAEKKRNQRVNRNTRRHSDLVAAPPRYVQVRISRMNPKKQQIEG